MNKNLLIIILMVSVLGSCKQNQRKRPDANIPPKYAITKEPKFHKDGSLTFTNTNGKPATFDIEIADTDAKREAGLMYRTKLNDDQAMLFIFNMEERQTFWMKNTPLSLDIIFVNDALEVVHVAHNCEPYSLKAIPSYEYARYVVEVKAGLASKLQIETGSTIEFSRL